MQGSASYCGQPRIPVHLLGTQVTRHQEGKTAAKASKEAEVDWQLGGQESDLRHCHWPAGKHHLYGICLQAPQTQDWQA